MGKKRLKQKGATLLEVMILVLIVGIMTTVYLSNGWSDMRSQKQLDAETEKFIGVIKQTQNYALTGKLLKIETVPRTYPCFYGFSFPEEDPGKYNLAYMYRTNPAADCYDANDVISHVYAENQLENGVTFQVPPGRESFGFDFPFGNLYITDPDDSAEESLTSLLMRKGSLTNTVCICGSGKAFYRRGIGDPCGFTDDCLNQ